MKSIRFLLILFSVLFVSERVMALDCKDPLTTPGSIAASEVEVCPGDPVVLTSTGIPDGPDCGVNGYVWEVSTTSATTGFQQFAEEDMYNSGNAGNHSTPITVYPTVTSWYRRGASAVNEDSAEVYTSVIKVTVKPKPDKPDEIFGPPTICIDEGEVVYSISAVDDATGYHWIVPPGWTIVSGQNETLIVVKPPDEEGTGTISVKATIDNGCEDSGYESLSVEALENVEDPPVINNAEFCDDSSVTIDDIDVTGNNLQWYDENDNPISNPNSINLDDGNTFFVTASNNFGTCESQKTEVEIDIKDPQQPVASSPQEFCEESAISDIAISGNNISWFDINNNPISSSTELEDGEKYYAISTDGNCESDKTEVEVNVGNPTSPTAFSPQEFCEESAISDIAISGNNISWFDINDNPISSSTELEDGEKYYAISTDGNCESDKTEVEIDIKAPQQPIASSPQEFCEESAISDIAISGNNISWFDINDNPISSSTELEDGEKYYAISTDGNCESDKIEVEIDIKDPQQPVASSPQEFCEEGAISDIVISGNNISWFDINNNPISSSTELEDGEKYYAISTDGNCESDKTEVEIDLRDPQQPVASSPQEFCEEGTISDIAISGNNISWFDINNNPISSSTELEDGEKYYAISTDGNCESDKTEVEIDIKDPQQPVASSPQEFCEEGTISDIAISGNNISWFDINNNPISSSTELEDGEKYYAMSTDGNCESDKTEVEIDLRDPQQPVATSPQEFCEESAISDIAISGNNISWFDINNNPTSSSTELEDGEKYYAISTDGNCESDKTEVEVNVGNPTSPTAFSPQDFCFEGQVSDLSVSGNNISWYNNNGDALSNSESLINNTNYYATQTDDIGCESEKTEVGVTITSPSAPTMDGQQSFCENAIVNDIDVSGNNITWYDANNNSISVTDLLEDETSYYATTTEGNCESEKSEVEVDVTVIPAPIADNEQYFCEAVSVADLEAESLNNHEINWYDSQNSISPLSSSTSLVNGATYYVAQTDGTCESQLSPVMVIIGNLSGINVESTNISCDGEDDGTASVNITGGTQGFSFSWNDPDQQNTSSIGDLSAGTYEVTITQDYSGCSTNQSVTITNPSEIFVEVSSDKTNCDENTGVAQASVTGGTGNYQFQWNDANQQTVSVATNLGVGDYQVTVMDANGCTATAVTTVEMFNDPTLSVENILPVSCQGEEDGSAEAVIYAGNGNYSYNWSPSNQTTAVVENLSPGEHTVVVTDYKGCSASETFTVSEPDELNISVVSTDENCVGNNGSAYVEIEGGNPGYTVEWSNGAMGSSVHELMAGTYTVVVTDANGCSVSSSTTVNYIEGIEIEVLPESATIIEGDEIQLFVNIENETGEETIEWTPTDGLSCTDCTNPIASPSETTVYTATVSIDGECVSTDYTKIYIEDDCPEFYIPNMFSPNGDNQNDAFHVYGDIDCVEEFSLEIYDRWGAKVFETERFDVYWYGNYDGDIVNTGTYAYKVYIKTKDGEEIVETGHLDLLR